MVRLPATLLACLVIVVPISADPEDVLLRKFGQQHRGELDKLRTSIDQDVARAKELKEINPEQGVEILRNAAVRLDLARLLSAEDRRAMQGAILPLIGEMRAAVLQRKRELAAERVDAFREYLVAIAPDQRYPGRSGADGWEPALFLRPDGLSLPGRLLGMGSGSIPFHQGREDKKAPPKQFPWIQVFGGFYVFDFANNHHMFLTNQEFADAVFLPLVRAFQDSDPRQTTAAARTEVARASNDARLQQAIRSGVLFVRGLPDELALPGVGDHEADFFAFAAQQLLVHGLPVRVERIYPAELLDTLSRFTWAQKSAVHRALFLAKAKGLGSSQLYPEILREETVALIRREYANFDELEINRALAYIFNTLR